MSEVVLTNALIDTLLGNEALLAQVPWMQALKALTLEAPPRRCCQKSTTHTKNMNVYPQFTQRLANASPAEIAAIKAVVHATQLRLFLAGHPRPVVL